MTSRIYLTNCTYGNADRVAAERITRENAHKPIRVMGPSDFYRPAKAPAKAPRSHVAASCRDRRKVLAEKCAAYLRAHGASSTVEISRAVHANAKSVAFACRELPGIRSEATTDKSGSRTVLWMLPVIAPGQ